MEDKTAKGTEPEKFMKEAIRQAKKAEKIAETPVGAVIVKDGAVIARGYNKRETKQNALCHAEISAINKACKKTGSWRLTGCELYVTLEPCPMCSGAIINSRIDKVFFGAYDKKAGCCGSAADLFQKGMFNHLPEIHGGILESECAGLLTGFFRRLRAEKKKK
ncbi:MAG TPA: nucleoside deaminase [Candidatus Ornithomonoglobus intestinigallinarum]|uniref:tRNA-specific adenosine deaminase n=1 Tax=Candidatus Ornithomonoglobus intestinigallinarum TaxID=2840894 RepID=A0A9D1H504_9FIRM|nr:nucleoside deaminase [Candidatus Ornithomonoglobus intestinigallinarum]